jgi:L-malate glycosyltransferase
VKVFSLHIDTARAWRGGQNQALLTVLGLRALGHRAVLVAHPEGELRKRASEGHDLIPLAPRTELDFRTAWRLSRVLRQVKPEIVHAHDPHGVAMASLALSIVAPTPDIPLVASRRVDFRLKGNSFSRWKYRQVDYFIAASDAIRAMLIADGAPAARVTTVHEGIDVDRVQAAPPANVHATFWLPSHAPLVGNVAALVPHKGHRDLIEAAALVVREVPDARFVILGEGPLRPQLERQIAERHLEKHVVLAGFRADVLSMHKGFDVFALTSVTEGLGTSLLDAMAAEKPVVATRVGGIPEVVVDGETGFLAAAHDHATLAARIVRLLRDGDLRARVGAAGLARVRAHFSVERMIAGTLDVYHRVAGTLHAADTGNLAARD